MPHLSERPFPRLPPSLASFGVAFAGALAIAATPAQAIVCYTLYDRNDNAIYQGLTPPIDLSDEGNADREVLRRRGEHLVFAEVERCPSIVFFTGDAGTTGLRLDAVSGPTAIAATAPGSAAPAKKKASTTGKPRATPEKSDVKK